ncbi:MAG: AAA family ATPase [Methanobacteriaceae archaeon]|nr:AAA family ATPase [Methanobacteriaceae archaeon]MDP2836026.1 AAA family ATPase [Methanobacteriaceae archaeon]MDP3034255.1 AAA family ATPase [Methanobacteriaceae archaeon]MDP3484003.1 AAA family ATPase [Methanobacteriaceae archaeon]MDP3622590.1 AAA family ATPase [Methanobacteriaceae archaeon]
MKVFGVSGMPGSGKGVVSRTAQKMGVKIIRMGDVVRDEAEIRGQEIGETAVSLRKEHGDYVVAEKCVEKIKKNYAESATDKITFMIEGIRSPYEIEIFQNNFSNFTVVSVFSSPKTRFRRLKRRKRSDDSEEYLEFQRRDKRELGFGIGEVISMSDYLIVNEGPLWRFKNQSKRIVKQQIDSKNNKNNNRENNYGILS